MNAVATALIPEFPRQSAPLASAADKWALFLDVDGCLVEFQPAPELVTIPESVLRTLAELHYALNGALALVSGRTMQQLDHLFAPLQLASAAQYGMERRSTDGTIHGVLLPDRSMADRVRQQAFELLPFFPGLKVEDKGYSVALHYRAAPQLERPLTAAAEAIVKQYGGAYEVQPGALVQEIKPATCSKGAAVRSFMSEAPFASRVPVFLGDDFADESAFAAVNTLGGISVAVGVDRFTQARYALSSPAATRRWLVGLLHALSV